MTRLLSYRDLSGRGITYSKVQLWRLEKIGKFPKRVPIGPKMHGWVEDEIEQFIGDKIRRRDQGYTRATKSV